MIVVSSLAELSALHGITRPALACGVFDGVHRGHQQIIAALVRMARRLDATPVVLTFEPHPRQVLAPDRAPPMLSTREQKLRMFKYFGAEAVIVLEFTPELASLSASRFVHQYLLVPEVHLVGICVGDKWRFGTYGHGDVNLLRHFGQRNGFEVVGVPEFTLYGKAVSSTRIRHAITHGRMGLAARLLGRPYAVCARVVHGRGDGGARLHCPTANLVTHDVLLPPNGVYAARGRLLAAQAVDNEEGEPECHDAAAYVGRAPTFTGDRNGKPIVEIHFFDLNGNFYGQELEVEFLAFIRPDQQFSSVAALAEQLKRDLREARRLCYCRHHRRRDEDRTARDSVSIS